MVNVDLLEHMWVIDLPVLGEMIEVLAMGAVLVIIHSIEILVIGMGVGSRNLPLTIFLSSQLDHVPVQPTKIHRRCGM